MPTHTHTTTHTHTHTTGLLLLGGVLLAPWLERRVGFGCHRDLLEAAVWLHRWVEQLRGDEPGLVVHVLLVSEHHFLTCIVHLELKAMVIRDVFGLFALAVQQATYV